MVLKTSKLASMRIKHSGIFSLEGLFHVMRDWIVHQGYQFEEHSVKHRLPSPAGAEQEYQWHGWKKMNEYMMYTFDAFIHVYNLQEIEMIKENGEKIITNQAAIDIWITPVLKFDYAGRFSSHPFMKGLQNWLHQYVWQAREIDRQWSDELYFRLLKLHHIIKDYLELETKTNAYENYMSKSKGLSATV